MSEATSNVNTVSERVAIVTFIVLKFCLLYKNNFSNLYPMKVSSTGRAGQQQGKADWFFFSHFFPLSDWNK